MSCSAPELIQHYFQELEARGIQAVILHGFDRLPEHWQSDIDYAVPREALHELVGIREEVARRHGWAATRAITPNLDCWYTVLFRAGHPGEFVQLDACGDFIHSKCLVATSEVLRAGAVRRGMFWTAAPAAEFEYHLGKSLSKGHDLARVLPRLRELAAQDPSRCAAAFRRLLGKDGGNLPEWLGRPENDWNSLASPFRRRCRFGLRLKLRECLRLLRRWWRPHGFWLSILGPDGAGKSTLIDALGRAILPSFRAMEIVHFRPGILDGKKPGPAVPNPHDRPPRSWLGSMAKLIFYFLDHWVGWALRVRPALVRNRLVIYDRDFRDVIVDPVRYRLANVGWFAHFLAALLPKPALTLVLDAPPEEIHRRKQELSVEELARQRTALRQMAERSPRWRRLDAGQPAEDVATQAIQTVVLHLDVASPHERGA
jgi:thymidylate kinase